MQCADAARDVRHERSRNQQGRSQGLSGNYVRCRRQVTMWLDVSIFASIGWCTSCGFLLIIPHIYQYICTRKRSARFTTRISVSTYPTNRNDPKGVYSKDYTILFSKYSLCTWHVVASRPLDCLLDCKGKRLERRLCSANTFPEHKLTIIDRGRSAPMVIVLATKYVNMKRDA